eukprot:m.140658 g.140658  ORF g.140658 m.140658 type:complete len:481 (+) comp16109_c0_seq2:142-1584(+)
MVKMARAFVALSALLALARSNSLIKVNLGNVKPSNPLLNGFNIDAASLYHGLDFNDANLIHAAQRLGPGVLRVGGGMADQIRFNGSDHSPRVPGSVSHTISATYWDSLVAFSRATKLQLLFDLNCFQFRTETGAWDPSNAIMVLQRVQDQNQVDALYGFELGNEPAHYVKRNTDGPNATQLAMNFAHLRQLVTKYFPRSSLRLFGPDLCCGFEYLDDFLQALSPGVLDAVTVHSYPLRGPKGNATNNCQLGNMTNPILLDGSDATLAAYALSRDLYAKDLPIVLGETATAGDGGCPELSNRYSAGFFWLDQLGRLHAQGWHGVFRQDLAGWSGDATTSNYALLGPPGWTNGTNPTPHPDFFTTLLWQQLAGDRAVEVLWQELTDLRIYASCTNDNTSVTVAFVNLGTQVYGLNVVGADMTFDDYTLTAASLTSDVVMLNGNALNVNSTLAGVTRTGTPEIAAHTYGFFVLKGDVATRCQS